MRRRTLDHAPGRLFEGERSGGKRTCHRAARPREGYARSEAAEGGGDANKFDLYVPADRSRQHYGLVVYLHSGGFTSGDKADDARTLHWLCAQGYVAAGINYTLFSEQHPGANILTQSLEIKRAWTRWSPRRPSWATP